jgi:hypothetical protein
MKYLIPLLTLFLSACNTTPAIIPDTTKDNVVMQKLKWEITNHNSVSTNWGWILWYAPLMVIAMLWAWRRYVKQCPECGKSEDTKPSV